MPLTDTKVKNAQPLDKEYKLTDGFGMFLRITPKGSKYWQMAYRCEGKQKIFSIGVYPAVSLAGARQRRDEARRLLAQGIDPNAKKQAEVKELKAKRDNTRTFKAVTKAGFSTKKKWSEEKALWLAKAAETNRPPMKRIHSAKWRSKASQEQRTAEQAVRDAAKQEAVAVYKTFSELDLDLDLEIIVDVRSFTVAVLAEPEEIVLPETRSGSSTNEVQSPVLVAPAPNTRIRGVKSYRDKSKVSKVVAGKKPSVSISGSGTNTILQTSCSQKPNRASRSAPERVKRKTATPRQDNIFKRFTALLVDFIRDKFIWAKTEKIKVDIISEEHDQRLAENYVFD